MASLPPQASQRHPSRSEPSSSPSKSAHEVDQDVVQAQSQSRSAENESPPSLVVALPTETASNAAAAGDADAATPKPEPRHCWICLQDEDEEGSDNSAWRSPCPCNLQAHEECMLEWIADLETPRSRRGRGKIPVRISCPQCKAEIQIERPRDILVSTVDLFDRTGRALLLPTGLSALFGCLYSGSLVYGLNSLYLVFGRDYAKQLLRRHSGGISVIQKLIGNRVYYGMLKLTEFTDPFIPTSDLLSLEMFVGLPMVAPALILSRTRLADYIFAILPLSLFALPLAFSSEHRQVRKWPPSPDLAFAVLPYIRKAYNGLYRLTFAEMEKKWDEAVLRKPREGETIEQVAQEQNEQNGDRGVLGMPIGAELELVVELGVGEAEAAQQEVVEAQLPPEAAQAGPNGADANAEAGQQQPNGAPAPQAAEEWQFAGRDIYLLDVASTIMGALFFPAISSLMGDLLKHTLPKKWVMKSVLLMPPRQIKTLPATGLLQEKWGRSVVGGCLFVVLKDALILYAKWRRAKDQGKKKILDYVAKG